MHVEQILIPGPMYGRWMVVKPSGEPFGVYGTKAEAERVAATPGVC